MSPYHRLLLGNFFVVCKGQCDNYYAFKKKNKTKKKLHLSIFKKKNVFSSWNKWKYSSKGKSLVYVFLLLRSVG